MRFGRTVSSMSFTEAALYFPRPRLRSPDHDVDDGAHNREWRTSSAGEARVSRADWIMGVSEVHKDRCGYIANGRVYRDLRIRVGCRNPDFPAPEGPIFYLSARLWIIPKKHAPMATRETYATRYHRQGPPGAGG